MKRIAENVAVTTLLYTMRPDAEIRIIDADHRLFPWISDWSAEGVPDGEVLTVDEILHKNENVRFAKSRIRHTEIINNQLLLVIDTEDEEY